MSEGLIGACKECVSFRLGAATLRLISVLLLITRVELARQAYSKELHTTLVRPRWSDILLFQGQDFRRFSVLCIHYRIG